MNTPSFLPHGYCYLWNPGLLSLHLASDSIIALAYYSIPLGLVWFVRRRRDVPFNWMFGLFALFIAGCGTTHLMEVWTLWHPSYWLAGVIKGGTALASIGTAAMMIPLLPRAVKLPSPEQLEAANRDLTAVNRELETFSYSVSHDLRAPLRAIDGFARALTEDYGATLDPEAQRFLGVIRNNATRMGQLIDDLLALSRSGRKSLERGPLDVESVARAVVEELRAAEPGREIEVTIGRLPPAHGDRGLVHQLLVNLIANAFKFTRGRPGARVEIGARSADAGTEYYVRDNGVGFDMRYADKLFGVFQRLHRAEEFDGTGVGLALVQRIVHRHGGRVWADARVDHGATFTFTLPHGERTHERPA
jgi:signal transduction histidine kinase